MASVVSICNLALTNIAKPEIQDIDEDSTEAQACRRFYDHCRDTLLQWYPWRFAQRTVALASITNDRPERWPHAYQRPNGCLKVLGVSDAVALPYMADDGFLVVAGAHAYAIEGSTIYSAIDPAYLVYIARVTDTTLFPPLFVEALSWHLAVRLSMPLTRDPKMRADAYQLAAQTSSQAAMADANEMRQVDDVPARAIEAR